MDQQQIEPEGTGKGASNKYLQISSSEPNDDSFKSTESDGDVDI